MRMGMHKVNMKNMSKKKLTKKSIEWTMGSNNVFADLEMPDAQEKLVKAELVFKINQLIKKKKMTQVQAAKILESDQSKISLLNKGRLSVFSIERLVHFLNLLNQDVEIVIKSQKRKSHHGIFRVIYA